VRTFTSVAELQKWLEEGLRKGTARGLLSAAERTVSVITTEVIPGENPPPVDEGIYRSSWRAEPTPEGADVVNGMPYASVIEYGARAENIKIGRAMIQALAAWALRKGFVARSGGDAAKGAESLAWAIAKSMQKRGIFNRDSNQGLRIGEKALAKAKAFVASEVAREVLRELR
jgi:hypothetical protein